MAKVQIGAVIGVEGAKQYKAQLDACTAATKNLASQTKLIEASFEGATRSVQDLAKQKIALKGEIAGVGEKLATQRAELSKVVEAYKRGDENALKYKNQMYDLATETNKTETELYKLEARLKELSEENGLTLALDAWKDATSKTGEALKKIGTGLTKYVTAPIVGLGGISVKTFSDIQSAFTGVKKTVNFKESTITVEELEEALRKLPLVTASSTEEIMGVAEAAGQLNVAGQDIPEFTKNVIMLADATNITSQEGAVSIAQFLNIMGEAPTTVDRFGSALVELGNNTATDEASILALSTRLASAGKFAGMSTPEILGLAAAMSSVGLTAEAGGTAMSTTLNMITKAVADGGDRLQILSDVAGMTAEQFSEKWRTDAIGTIQDLLVGFGDLEGGSEEMLQLMDELGWAGIRQSDAWRRLTLSSDGVTKAVDMSNKAYEEGTKLAEEASQRYGDFASQMSQFKESFRLFASSLGESLGKFLYPAIEGLTTLFKNLDSWWRGLDSGVQGFILSIAGIVAAIGPALVIFGNILIFVSKFKAAVEALGLASKLASLLGVLGGAIVPIAAFIAALGGIYLAIKNWDSIKEFVTTLWENIKQTFMDALGAIWEGISTIGSNIWGVISALLEDILSGVLKLFEWLAGQLILFVVNTLPNFVSKVVNWVKTMGTNVWNGIKSMASNALNTVKNLGSSIGDTFRNLASSAWSWGADIISSLTSGIRSRISSLISSVSNVASTIWSYLHFSEPEKGALKDFHTWMPDMMQGMAQGIYDNMYLVDRAAATVADSLGMGGNTSYNYGGVVINLNVPQGANGYQLVDQIEDALAQRTVRRRAVFG